MIRSIFNYVIIFITIFILTSCSSTKKEKTAVKEYKKAMKILKNNNFVECANKFDEIIEEFPFSHLAKEAKILASYCYYKDKSYPETITLAEDYISNYPSDKNVIYMQYLRSISYYNQMPSISRSQFESKLALYGFRDIMSRNIDSIHAKDAMKKIKIINENIAGYHMEIGRFYQKKENYIGAINNFNYVIDNYSFTSQYPESLYRIYSIYYKLGMFDEAGKAKNLLLKKGLKNNKWLKYLQKISG